MDEATLIVRREAIYDELMRHVVTNGRCDCGRFTERAPHYAPFARHLAAELAALHLNLAAQADAPAERCNCWRCESHRELAGRRAPQPAPAPSPGLTDRERHAIDTILDRPYGDPDDDAAIAARAAARLARNREGER